MRQSGSAQSSTSKVFMLAGQQLSLVAQSPSYADGTSAIYYSRPGVNGDASIIAINGPAFCEPGQPCPTTIRTPTGSLVIDGRASLSTSGRFAAVYGNYYQAPPYSVRLVDFVAGTVVVIGPQPAHEGQFVADDGTILSGRDGGVRLSGPKGTVDLTPVGSMGRAMLARDASRIVYDGPIDGIHVLEVASNTDRLVVAGFLPMLAADGRTFAYLNGGQVWIADAITGASRLLTMEAEPIVDLAISGDGSRVFAVTESGRLLSVNTANGAAAQMLGAVGPLAYGLAFPPVPGSYNELIGYFAQDFAPDLRVSGVRATALENKTDRIAIQIPWEAKADPQAEVILRFNEPAWEQLVRIGVFPILGSTFALAGGFPAATAYVIREDWSTVVYTARPGDVLHLYATGWGPVDGTIQDGQPTPVDRLYRITSPCQWMATGFPSRQQRPFEVLFAGLAPTLTGIYQFDFRIPADWSDATFAVSCSSGATTYIGTPDLLSIQQ
jgi:uncharacterized protein (TIGR03437 family)